MKSGESCLFFWGLFSSTRAHLLYSDDVFLCDPAQSYRDLTPQAHTGPTVTHVD